MRPATQCAAFDGLAKQVYSLRTGDTDSQLLVSCATVARPRRTLVASMTSVAHDGGIF